MPRYSDQYLGYFLMGTSALTIILTTVLFVAIWPAQMARAAQRA